MGHFANQQNTQTKSMSCIWLSAGGAIINIMGYLSHNNGPLTLQLIINNKIYIKKLSSTYYTIWRSGHPLKCLNGPGGTFCHLICDPQIITATRIVVQQQTVIIVPELQVGGLWVGLWCRYARATCALNPLRGTWSAGVAVLPVSIHLLSSSTLFLRSTQFRVAESPHHPAKIDEERAHNHNHERVRLYHCFGYRRRHFQSAQEQSVKTVLWVCYTTSTHTAPPNTNK